MGLEEIARLVAIKTEPRVKAETRRTADELGQLGLAPIEQRPADALINQPVEVVHMPHAVRQ